MKLTRGRLLMGSGHDVGQLPECRSLSKYSNVRNHNFSHIIWVPPGGWGNFAIPSPVMIDVIVLVGNSDVVGMSAPPDIVDRREEILAHQGEEDGEERKRVGSGKRACG